jgi:predicted nucleic acid-binding protein
VFEMADQGEATIFVPTICLVETVYLSESLRIPERSYDRLLEILRGGSGDGSYQMVPLTLQTTSSLRRVPRHLIRELPDRVIAATSLDLGLPLITKDEALRGWDGITTLW